MRVASNSPPSASTAATRATAATAATAPSKPTTRSTAAAAAAAKTPARTGKAAQPVGTAGGPKPALSLANLERENQELKDQVQALFLAEQNRKLRAKIARHQRPQRPSPGAFSFAPQAAHAPGCVESALAHLAATRDAAVVNTKAAFVAMVIDRSGSMQSMGSEVAGGINLFLDEQRKDDAKTGATTSLLFSTFDTVYEKLHDGVDLRSPSVRSITDADVAPRGATALHDSMAFCLKDTAEAVARLPARPAKVIVYVLTDGAENGSQVYTAAQVRAFLATLKAEHGWEFIFAAANQDALATGQQSFGLAQADCLTYSAKPQAQRMQFAAMSSAVSRCKGGRSKAFTPAERTQCTM